MKIGLIDPGSKKLTLNENFPHVGLAYIAAILEGRGHEIKILDASLVQGEDIEHFIRDGHELIGLSATSFTFTKVLEVARAIKTISNDAKVVLGGPHVPIAMESTLDSSHIDYAVYGEGELTMLELTELLHKSREPKARNLSAIKGLIFRDEDRAVSNPVRPRINNLDGLPFPSFHLFHMDKYGMYPLLTSRGCPFGCSFCAIKAIWGVSWKYRSPESIIQEIEHAQKRFHWEKPFNIIDDSFNVYPNRVMQFCELVIERGMNIKWFSSGFRPDRVSLELAMKMKESGCIGVSVGMESASNNVLKRINKKTTAERSTQGCKNLARAGIPAQAQFMIGNPGDTFETVKSSIKFAKKHRFPNCAFYLALPYPKTELWDYVKKEGTFLKEDYMKFHHFSSEPVFETLEFPAKERIKAYELGRRLALQNKIREEVKTKLARIKYLDFKEMSLKRATRALVRLTKYLLDLSFRRDEKV